eukprot:70178-Chlamydomonas_euryale.AAC.4
MPPPAGDQPVQERRHIGMQCGVRVWGAECGFAPSAVERVDFGAEHGVQTLKDLASKGGTTEAISLTPSPGSSGNLSTCLAHAGLR